MLVFSSLIIVEVSATKNSVREEMEASGRIAMQFIAQISNDYSSNDLNVLINFFKQTGRIRANDIKVYDNVENIIYESPPPTYKAGRDAPGWYSKLISPPFISHVFDLKTAKIEISTNSSRAILDGWDKLLDILLVQFILFLIAELIAFWLIGRWLKPLEKIEVGLKEIELGDHKVRLPPLNGKEVGQMGRSFNRMAQAVEDNISVRQKSAEAQARLEANREFTQLLQSKIEEERSALARELHDELGQSLTAIRSISKSLIQREDLDNISIKKYAEMLFETAGNTSDSVRRMIPRLRPLKLEGMGLVDAVRDLVTDLKSKYNFLKINLHIKENIPFLEENLELTSFRIIQEALNNIIQHSDASRADILISLFNGELKIIISDNGKGAILTQKDGHYGVRGMQERVESHGGNIEFKSEINKGLEVIVLLPIKQGKD